ncbi:MAG: sigma-70 family RNA polymerase sigma factor [Verrucomicrobiota bacterium JB023]|nr:sigma-70 family RNA polymerase sigma factor [Verrucomicrobiota bacterium JB023]
MALHWYQATALRPIEEAGWRRSLFARHRGYLVHLKNLAMPMTHENATDALTLEQWLASDELRHGLLQAILRRVRDPHLAEDLTQEVLVKAFSNRERLREEERAGPWIFRIARHVIADHFRRERMASPLGEEEGEAPVFLGQGPDGDDFPEILGRFLRKVVAGLPPIYRDALSFTDCGGGSQVELAKSEGISISGAKSRVQRARASVREAVERCCFLETDPYGGVVHVEPRPDYCGD